VQSSTKVKVRLIFSTNFSVSKKSLRQEIKANISAILSKKLKPEQNFYHSLKAASTILFKNAETVHENQSATSDDETRRKTVVTIQQASAVYKQNL
jgi:hypothetical protein